MDLIKIKPKQMGSIQVNNIINKDNSAGTFLPGNFHASLIYLW